MYVQCVFIDEQMKSVFGSSFFLTKTVVVSGFVGGLFNLLHKKETLFSKIKTFTDLWEPNLCIFLTNFWGHLK